MRRGLAILLTGILTIFPIASANAYPLFTSNKIEKQYEVTSYLGAWFVANFDITTLELIFGKNWYLDDFFGMKEIDQINNDGTIDKIQVPVYNSPDNTLYPKATATNGVPTGDPVVPATSDGNRCSSNCPGASGSVGYAPGEVGYSDGIHTIVQDPSTGRIYEALNGNNVSSDWVARGCEASIVAGCFK